MTSNLPSQCRFDKDANAVRFYVESGGRTVECLVDVEYLKCKHGLPPDPDANTAEKLVEGLSCITDETKEIIVAGQPEPVLLTSLTLQSAREMNKARKA